METTTDVGLVFEDFKDRIGGAFTLSEPEFPAIALTLEEATLLPIHSGTPITRPPFSLIFVGGGQHILPQKQYDLNHAALGKLTLFLVPVGRDSRGVQYQALFN